MQRKIAGVLPLLCLAICAAQAYSQVSPNQIDAVFASFKSNTAPGVAALVIYDGHAVFHRGYGVTDLRTLRKIDEHTNFRLASLTKQFTAACIMLLARDGKLHYDDHLIDFFPAFPAYGKSITVRNLLNHTSGLEDYGELLVKQYPGTPLGKVPQILDAGVLKLLEQQPSARFPAGTKWEYSSSGYAVLATIVEKTSGEPFGEFLQERIFKPLKMKHTLAYEKGKNEVPHRAYGHTKKEDGWHQADQSPVSAVLGDGGIYSSARRSSRMGPGPTRAHTVQRSRNAAGSYSSAIDNRAGEISRWSTGELWVWLVSRSLPGTPAHVS